MSKLNILHLMQCENCGTYEELVDGLCINCELYINCEETSMNQDDEAGNFNEFLRQQDDDIDDSFLFDGTFDDDHFEEDTFEDDPNDYREPDEFYLDRELDFD